MTRTSLNITTGTLKIGFHTFLCLSTNSLIFLLTSVDHRPTKVAVRVLARLPRESYANSLVRLGLREYTLSRRLSAPQSRLLKVISKRIFPHGCPSDFRVKQIVVPSLAPVEQSTCSAEGICFLSIPTSQEFSVFTLRLPRLKISSLRSS